MTPAPIEIAQHISDVVAAHLDSHGLSDSEHASIHLDVLSELGERETAEMDSNDRGSHHSFSQDGSGSQPFEHNEGAFTIEDYQHNFQSHDNYEGATYDLANPPA